MTMKNNSLSNLIAVTVIIFTVRVGSAWGEEIKSKLPACEGTDFGKWNRCFGMFSAPNGEKYVGEFSNGKYEGKGTQITPNGSKYVGEFKNGKYDGTGTHTYSKGGQYVGDYRNNIRSGKGTYYTSVDNDIKGDMYVGEWRDDMANGQGFFAWADGTTYMGEWKDNKRTGQGVYTKSDGKRLEGIFENDQFIREAIVNLPKYNNSDQAKMAERNQSEREQQQLAQQRKKLEEENRYRGQVSYNQSINLQVTNTEANAEGDFIINIQTGTDTASLKVNGQEFGGRADGNYVIKKIARAGQETNFTIIAKDTSGNTDSKIITVSRPLVDSKPLAAALNPAQVKRQPERDAVAVIIGIADYKNLPRADYANDDARVFYDYAIRALGVKPENIKLLVDADADEVGIYRAFKTWLPSRVRSTTDVYVYYSGHGLPTADGQGLYVLPQRADRDFIDKTAITQSEINVAIQAAKPKSVTIFLDACYSGQARTGETLLASARPVSLKADTSAFPDGFTVITASRGDQISSSSPELKHGIFSYYLMRGMEGDADVNRDGKITIGEMQAYLAENVARQAGMMNRRQEPQIIGDRSRVLVGR
jgi:hypothetical protein